jgi:hypothetical protein
MRRAPVAMQACAVLAAVNAPAVAQLTLYAYTGGGNLLSLDQASGAATPIASSIPATAAGPLPHSRGWESILVAPASAPDQLVSLNRWSGVAAGTIPLTGRPPGYAVTAITGGPQGMLIILHSGNANDPDLLARVVQGAIQSIGPTGRRDLVALTSGTSGSTYALGTGAGGTLYLLSTNTGGLTAIGGGGFGDSTALSLLPDGRMFAAGSNLLAVDTSSGQATLIGPTGLTDIRGLAALERAQFCYANCDNCSFCSPPFLNVLDFNCFLNSFLYETPYANCDQSTTPPVLNVLDFNCFLNRFSAGCSAP